METELKEGDDAVLRLKVIEQFHDGRVCGIAKGSGEFIWLSPSLSEHLRKVRPGTYEVTARDVAKMICRACWTFWVGYMRSKKPSNGGKLEQPHFKKLRRWVHCRLRELRRKRKQ